MDQKEHSTNQGKEEKKSLFSIQRIYVKDLSFETPNTPQLFSEPWQPNVNIELNVATSKVNDNTYEVQLIITVTAKSGEKVAFLAEVHQAGVFIIQEFPDAQLHRMLGSYCPNLLFPYAREVVSDLVARGGFPQLYLAPVNFEAAYEQQLQKQQQGGAASAGEGSSSLQ